MSNARIIALVVVILGLGLGTTCGIQYDLGKQPRPGKDLAKQIVVQETVYHPLSIRSQRQRMTILSFGTIVEIAPERSRTSVMTKAEFEIFLNEVKLKGIKPVTAEGLRRHLCDGNTLSDIPLALTFDNPTSDFYYHVFPLLQQFQVPAIIMVRPSKIGTVEGAKRYMSWEDLRKLEISKLIAIGCVISGPGESAGESELKEADNEIAAVQQSFTAKLGHPVRYLSWSDGAFSSARGPIAKDHGFFLGFVNKPGPAEESNGIFALRRYEPKHWQEALEECQKSAEMSPAAVIELAINPLPVSMEVNTFARIKMAVVRGGLPSTHIGATRMDVGEYVRDSGGVAGINGGFFADARIVGTSATMIGPCKTVEEKELTPDNDPYRLPKLRNRPVVILSANKIAIAPFHPGYMNRGEAYKELMPDYTDVFLAGAWLVHDGRARTVDELRYSAAKDVQDTRRRTFFGIGKSGELVVGATLESVTSSRLAEAAAEAGAVEAVLLDSGFSSALVFDNRILATGHTATNLPSRPVPHAVVISGTLKAPTDPEQIAVLLKAKPAVGNISSHLALQELAREREKEIAARKTAARLNRLKEEEEAAGKGDPVVVPDDLTKKEPEKDNKEKPKVPEETTDKKTKE